MARKVLSLSLFMLTLFVSQTTLAYSIYIGVDAAPNKYGSSLYPAWEAEAFAAISSGSFVNMKNSINPLNSSTTNYEIEDVVVYSFGDLGKRLSFVYWIPGATTESIKDTFQISLTYTFDGVFHDLYDEYYGSTWLTPTSWKNYDSNNDSAIDGVVGVAGNGWWGAYGVNLPEALEALNKDLKEWGAVDESWTLTARILGITGTTENSLTATRAATPEPSTMLLMAFGGASALWIRLRKTRNT